MEFRFYDELPELTSLADTFRPENYREAPPDWCIILTDVRNSTDAINRGLYKEVNIAGAVGIIAVSNLFGHLRFPYMFGGDGVTMLLPPQWRDSALKALADVAVFVERSYGLQLRIGQIDVSSAVRAGGPITVAKTRVSERYTQASFDGPGVDYSEELLKSGMLPSPPPGDGTTADTSGFSCRWDEVPSQPGEIMALIVEARASDPELRRETMQVVGTLIDRHIGESNVRHPVSNGPQHMIRSLHAINRESAIHARGRRGLPRIIQTVSILLQMTAVRIAIGLRLPLRLRTGKLLSKVPEHNVVNADFQKYDGRLKTIVACSSEARAALIDELDTMEANGKIRYGVHLSDRSVMTCLIHAKAPDEVHFVDAADGGYARAASMLKEKYRAGAT